MARKNAAKPAKGSVGHAGHWRKDRARGDSDVSELKFRFQHLFTLFHRIAQGSPKQKEKVSATKVDFSGEGSYIWSVANVTKQDLIQDVTCATGIVKNRVRVVVEQLLDLVGESLSEGNSIEIRGFGTFAPKVRKARPVRNPRTGEALYLQQRTVSAFKFSSELKAAIMQSVSNKAAQVSEPAPAEIVKTF